jgi:dihydroorotase
MRLLIKGGRVIDPANGLDAIMDLLLDEGRILAVEKELADDAAEVINARDKLVCPGFIDMHVHLREPGYEYKEDITSGSKAAAAGGFTTVCSMPNTEPAIDNAAIATFIRERARKTGLTNVFPIGTITRGRAGNELSEMAELVSAGCIAVSDDGSPVMRADVMRNGLEYAKMFSLPVLAHCEDLNLSRDGQMHEGYYSIIYGLKGIPAEAEEVMIARDIALARLTGGHLHVCHISTMGAVDLIREAKEEGIKVTCEVTPHHLILSDETVGTYDANTKVSPPLRSWEHIEALREALNEGVIDCIATDHAPHHLESKDCEYVLASPGISGLETAVALIMNELVDPGILDIERMVSLFTTGPAEILGLDRGTLTPGKVADITLLDPNMIRTVVPANFYSKGKNTPFGGRELKGWPYMTIRAGKIVAREGKIVS